MSILSQLLQNFPDNFVTAAIALIAVALGFFSVNYLSKRRTMLHQERMASLIKGLHYAGVAQQIFNQPKSTAKEYLIRGLKWLFGGLGLAGTLFGFTSMQPTANHAEAAQVALAGIVPASIGIAHFVSAAISRQRPNVPRVFAWQESYRRRSELRILFPQRFHGNGRMFRACLRAQQDVATRRSPWRRTF